jgi:hypothetical protein
MVAGGKPKMYHFFNNDAKEWPSSSKLSIPRTQIEKDELVDLLHAEKTSYYLTIVEEMAKPRPGVLELMDAAIADPSLKVPSR